MASGILKQPMAKSLAFLKYNLKLAIFITIITEVIIVKHLSTRHLVACLYK